MDIREFGDLCRQQDELCETVLHAEELLATTVDLRESLESIVYILVSEAAIMDIDERLDADTRDTDFRLAMMDLAEELETLNPYRTL